MFLPGNVGEFQIPKISPMYNSQYLEVIDSGQGGVAPGFVNSQKNGNNSIVYNIYNATGVLLSTKYYRQPYSGNPYTAAGGGVEISGNGMVGGNGLVIIWF
jgi:hypothetical protein